MSLSYAIDADEDEWVQLEVLKRTCAATRRRVCLRSCAGGGHRLPVVSGHGGHTMRHYWLGAQHGGADGAVERHGRKGITKGAHLLRVAAAGRQRKARVRIWAAIDSEGAITPTWRSRSASSLTIGSRSSQWTLIATLRRPWLGGASHVCLHVSGA